MSVYQDKLKAQAVQAATTVSLGRNPAQNRLIERAELKKACIALLSGTDLYDAGIDDVKVNATAPAFPRPNVPPHPNQSLVGSDQEAFIRFFEQAFEWEHMMYVFYPYYWARRETWYASALADDPDVFPERGLSSRADEWKRGDTGNTWREVPRPGSPKLVLHPSRHFPPPGEPLRALKKGLLIGRDGTELRDDKLTLPQLPEIRYVIQFIEQYRPIRIVSVHGIRARSKDDLEASKAQTGMTDKQIDDWDGVSAIKGVNFPGIFVDPRYQLGKDCPKFDLQICKFDPLQDPSFPMQSQGKDGKGTDRRFDSARTAEGKSDDALALKAAQAVAKLDPTLVCGNHVDEAVPVVHYAKESGTPAAFSLGDWGPVEVLPSKGFGARAGAPVFTVEVSNNQQSWAFLDGIQVMSESGKPLPQTQLPEERAAKSRAQNFLPSPEFTKKFSQKRSQQLQAYAQGIIDTVLELR